MRKATAGREFRKKIGTDKVAWMTKRGRGV